VQSNSVVSEYEPYSEAAMQGRYADAAVGGPRRYAPPQDGWARLKPDE